MTIIEAIKVFRKEKIPVPEEAIEKMFEYIDDLERRTIKINPTNSMWQVITKERIFDEISFYVTRYMNEESVDWKNVKLSSFIKRMKDHKSYEDESDE